MQLIHYTNACREIALAATMDEAKDWADKAAALQAYYHQAHNTELEVQVAEIKLRALRRMGELSSALEKAQVVGGRGGEPDLRNPTGGKSKTEQLEQAGISTSTAHRAEQIAAIPEDEFESRLALQRERQVPATQKNVINKHRVAFTSENEWYTPSNIIELARQAMGSIDLDPASSLKAQETVKAGQYFTEDENGLEQEWFGNVWLNPPYEQPFISQFISKLCNEIACGNVSRAILITHNSTETKWFQEAVGLCQAVCFTRSRIRFVDTKGNRASPTQGQALFYFGEDVDSFAGHFSTVGYMMTPHG